MNTDIKIPQLPESCESANISRIYVSPGQQVDFEQALFDVETDKVVLEIVSPASGVVHEFEIIQGQQVISEQRAMSLAVKENSNSNAPIDKKEHFESPTENIVPHDPERLALEQVIGQSLFDKRGQICGALGLLVGLIIGVFATLIVLG